MRTGQGVNKSVGETHEKDADMTPDAPMTAQDALAALMVAVSASDETIRTAELVKMSNAINNLPVFADYDTERLPRVSKMVFELLEQEDGLEALFGLIRDALPEKLFETAYALSCDVAAADGEIDSAEARMLEEIRYELEIDRLHAAAIERGSRARHMTL
ncbi:MAG: tellurite resistance protein [Yoonia sp.]